MHILHNSIGLPKITQKDIKTNTTVFTMGPLPRGYGVTLANSLRRVALSSIPGTKVTGIKVAGVEHEYSTLPGVKDSVIEIILNLKGLVLTKNDSGSAWLKLKKNKAGIITAADIECPSDITILNPDLYITELDQDKLQLELDIRVEKNVGYVSIEELRETEDDIQVIGIDANFSPVVNVRYDIVSTRIGDLTNLETIEIEIETNGSSTPLEAIKFSGQMLTSYFSLLNADELQVGGAFIGDIKDLIKREKDEVKEELEKESYTPIEIMGLSPRTLNALINGNILSIEQLTKCTETKLSSIKGFGKKAMTEIRDALKSRGLKLLGDD
ncbi:DNA-directed RNA polymerase subunit alpha [Candidatus Gracilibacteria bacterium]|nr:DNA-directed RNA polymerase subunit alpha [Candidatus Gracilibacteria bacterium]